MTDHSQEAPFAPTSATNAAWLATKREASEAADNRFTALAGFEFSENNGPGGRGHINVFNPKDKIVKIDIVKDGGVVAQTFTPAPAFSVRWSPNIHDATNRYFFVRVWNAGGGDAPGADPSKPVAWLAPVWIDR